MCTGSGEVHRGSWRLEETDFRKMLPVVEFSLRSNNLETYQVGTVIYINEHEIRFGGSQSFCQKTSRNGCNGVENGQTMTLSSSGDLGANVREGPISRGVPGTRNNQYLNGCVVKQHFLCKDLEPSN